MIVNKIIIKNFKSLRDRTVLLNNDISIIVGDNETGKSTLLEAINLAFSGQLNGRSIQYELNPFLFNNEAVKEYIDSLIASNPVEPPSILIEVYLQDDPSIAILKGNNNSLKEDVPGIKLSVEFDQSYSKEYKEYIKVPKEIKTVPVEYYRTVWYSFAHNSITSRSIPINVTYIDTTIFRMYTGVDKYISKIIDDVLTPKERADLALEFRKLKEVFSKQGAIGEINKQFASKKGEISNKDFSISIDISPRTTWESNIIPYLDDTPFSLIGKGEQNSVKMKLALKASIDESNIFLIEEPENHLSFTNMNKLINDIESKCSGKQLIITTHSAFVLNKLGVEKLILLANDKVMTLNSLSTDTREYFMKLPGYDTLRLILSKKSILVEGPSDELIVQKAYFNEHSKLPIHDGVDVMSVRALAFKRFLEIAVLLKINVAVVTDNDGDINKLNKKYVEYQSDQNIKIFYDKDINCRTLEPQILKANSLNILNDIFGKTFTTESEILEYMSNNKTEYALKIFSTNKNINFPQYIKDAIK